MSTQRQLRRGTTGENAGFTGAVGELVADTEGNQLRLHNGAKEGGFKFENSDDLDAREEVLKVGIDKKAEKTNSGNVLEAGRAANLLLRHETPGQGARMHIEPNSYVDSGTASKLDLMFDPYEDDPANYRILNFYCKNGDGSGLNGENGAAVINAKATGDHWGVWPSIHFAFQDDGSNAVPMKMYLFDTSDTVWRTPMTGAWRQGRAITTGDYALNDFKIYQATTTGTTGTVAPAHTSGNASDGGVSWDFVRDVSATGSSVRPVVMFGDREDMPIFGFGECRAQFLKSSVHAYGARLKFAGFNGNRVAEFYTSNNSGQDFLNLDISGDGSAEMRFSTDGYYQSIGLARTLNPLSLTGLETVIDVTSTEMVVFGNASATTVSNFTGHGYQVIKLMSSNGQTTIAHNSNIRLAGGVNLTLSADDCIELVSDGSGVWKQVR